MIIRHARRAVGALLFSSLPVLSWAACAPLDAPFGQSAQSEGLHAQALRLELPAHNTRILLGMKGERVVAGSALISVDGEDLMPHTWADAVDWSVYGAAKHQEAYTVLQRDADGRLCRIDRLRDVRGRPSDDGGFRLAYDDQGRLSGYAEYAGAGDTGMLLRQACLLRDSRGAISAVYAECGATPNQAVYYVRDAQGKLLRIINRGAGPNGAEVRRLGADGGTQTVYRWQGGLEHTDKMLAYAVPANSADRLLIVEAGTSPVIETGIPDQSWQVVRVPADTVEGDAWYSWDPASHTVLLEGKSDATGKVMLDAGQVQTFHQAVQETPGRVFFYVSPSTRFLPVRALDAQVWQRCADPAQTDAKACG